MSASNVSPRVDVVDTTGALGSMIDEIRSLPTNPPSLYLDVEGVNLSRLGSVSIVQIYVHPTNRAYLIDICTLQSLAFSARGSSGYSLKDILESPLIPKVFFDVRNDSDALYSHYGIRLAGIQDLQLMELGSRHFRKSFVMGLARCVEKDLTLTPAEHRAWKATKDLGMKLFKPELGGSYEVFNQRPLQAVIAQYCVQDVYFLPRLWTVYNERIPPSWRERIATATKDRVIESQSVGYVPQGRHKAEAPKGWAELSAPMTSNMFSDFYPRANGF